MSTEDGGLRERKKRETRAALSWAAIRLTVERGFDNVRIEDIAEAAGVSTRTFSNYFGSKGEAIAARHIDRCLGVAEELRGRPAGEPIWESITHATLKQLVPGPELEAHPVQDHQRWVAGLKVMSAEPAIQGELMRASAVAQTALAAAVAERTGTDATRDLYPQLVAAAVLSATNAAMHHWQRADPPVSMEWLMTDALAQLAAGLPAPDTPTS
ncbi:acyl-CoA-like ligand-binding transcription factor [Rugosimonospora africana]|uniref:TetR family transcriptional regulator n=1 Tax=Rugosimonospora africana TaxID=556532 RepID=A0A8J3QSF8_9ACTN|nr:TetR family transcriptional regulator [Rugosimonospora africana]GIH15616.1 TetR family transcriptional regulator [Rugosimonospora africana]